MVVSKLASLRIVALAVILAGTVWQPLRAGETATQDTSDRASCARSTFRVLIDVGHTATSPGADSARGVPEYEFPSVVTSRSLWKLSKAMAALRSTDGRAARS
jgi:hypothetical protein